MPSGLPLFPAFERSPSDPFLQSIHASGKKWVILTDGSGTPHLALDSDAFLRDVLFESKTINPYGYCHRPVIVTDQNILLGTVISRLKVHPTGTEDDVIDKDMILVWGAEKRVITGADILGRLLRGIAIRETVRMRKA